MSSENEKFSRIDDGMHAHIVNSGNVGSVFKITRCPESIELLRILKKSPVYGLPEVLNEIHTEDVDKFIEEKFRGLNAVCFEVVKYKKIDNTLREFKLINEILMKYKKVPAEGKIEKQVLKEGAHQLENEGFYTISNVINYLIDFLEDRPKAHIDTSPVNFMIDDQGNMIWIDPVSHSN